MLRVDPKELKKKLLKIVAERHPLSSPRHLAEVENTIEREFRSDWLHIGSDTFRFRGKAFRNVIGRTGSTRAPLSSSSVLTSTR